MKEEEKKHEFAANERLPWEEIPSHKLEQETRQSGDSNISQDPSRGSLVCKHCGATSKVEERKNGPHVGLYCLECGRWIKWVAKA